MVRSTISKDLRRRREGCGIDLDMFQANKGYATLNQSRAHPEQYIWPSGVTELPPVLELQRFSESLVPQSMAVIADVNRHRCDNIRLRRGGSSKTLLLSIGFRAMLACPTLYCPRLFGFCKGVRAFCFAYCVGSCASIFRILQVLLVGPVLAAWLGLAVGALQVPRADAPRRDRALVSSRTCC